MICVRLTLAPNNDDADQICVLYPRYVLRKGTTQKILMESVNHENEGKVMCHMSD